MASAITTPSPTSSRFTSRARRYALHPLALASASLCASFSFSAHAGDEAALLAQSTEATQIAAAGASRKAGAATPALKEVVISASRDEQNPDTLPMTVDVIHSRQMEEAQITDIRELTADIPNVTVPRTPARFSLASRSTGRSPSCWSCRRKHRSNRSFPQAETAA